jgi:hypothetical protein
MKFVDFSIVLQKYNNFGQKKYWSKIVVLAHSAIWQNQAI